MSAAPKSADAPAKRRGKLPLIIGLVVLLAGGGGGGYFWWSRQQAVKAAEADPKGGHGDAKAGHGETAAAAAEGGEHGGALLPLSTFTVNLADTEATRFLRTNVQLVLEVEEEVLKELEEEKLPVARARSTVLELLAQQKSTDLTTPEGKAALKKAIAEQTSKALHHKVSDVLFSDFVIQF